MTFMFVKQVQKTMLTWKNTAAMPTMCEPMVSSMTMARLPREMLALIICCLSSSGKRGLLRDIMPAASTITIVAEQIIAMGTEEHIQHILYFSSLQNSPHASDFSMSPQHVHVVA